MSRPRAKKHLSSSHPSFKNTPPSKYLKIAASVSLLFISSAAWATTCTKTNFFIGYEIVADSGPNASGQYNYVVTPVRCSAGGQVVYDPGIGFDDRYPIGTYTPAQVYSSIKNAYLYNQRVFEGSCKLNYLGVATAYNGAINGVGLATATYPVSQTPYTGVFTQPVYAPIGKQPQGVQKDGQANSTNLCTAGKQNKEPSGAGGGNSNKPKKCTANPIFPDRGCKIQSEEDYRVAGNSLLEIVRYYDSQDPYHIKSSGPRLVGNRWWLNLDAKLNADIEPNKVLMLYGDGTLLHFTPKAGSTTEWVGDADVVATLVKSGTSWTYQIASGTVETYNTDGQRTSSALPDGRALTYTYDTAGKLATVADHTGRTLTLAYNAQGLVTSITDGTNTLVAYTYDTESNLTSAAYPDGTTRQYSYTSKTVGSKVEPALLTGITDENGVLYASWTYGPDARALSSQHAGGVDHYTLTYVDGAQGKIAGAGVTTPLGAEISYDFQETLSVNNLTNETHPLIPSASRSYTYDAQGNLSSRTDYKGNVTNYTYDLTRNLETQRIEAFGTAAQRTITTQWHTTWRRPVKIAGPNKITAYTYNGDNSVLCAPSNATQPDPAGGTRPIGVACTYTEQATTDANGSQGLSATPTGTPRTWTTTYNAQGQRLTEDGPRADVTDTTTYTYYPLTDATPGNRGNLATITNPLSHVTEITAYDANGNPLTIVDPNGVTTTLAYDARQRLTSRSKGGETTTYQYNATGQLTQITLPDGRTLAYTYDAAHRLTDVTDTLGNSIHYTLDNAGNRTQEDVKDPQGALTRTRSRVYDALSQLAQDIGAQSQTTTYAYDANGNQTTTTDPLSRNTVKAYDALDRLIQITDPGTGEIHTTWNGQDQITQIKDPRNLITTYTLNGLGDTTSTQSPDTGTTTSTYDNAGNELTRTDAKGQTTTTQYDALSRITQITDASGKQIQFTWDQGTNGKGQLTKIEEIENSVVTLRRQYTYDALGRLVTETRTLDPSGTPIAHTQAYTYLNGRLSTYTLPSGRQLAYTYNAAGQVTKIDLTHIAPKAGQTQTLAQSITYHPYGGLKSWADGAGQTHTRTQDQDGRTNAYTLGGTQWLISYDAAGRIIGQAVSNDATQSASYTYNAIDHLTGAQLPATSYGYTYDATGNRTSQTIGGTT
ncbi:MAG: DUF6531 domain-containing protein, partial [Candidatus Accumulibacter sp.]|nr:DUF6531 domain-containing protein [Accumulibacter sp.]